jgi:hypothetical protein
MLCAPNAAFSEVPDVVISVPSTVYRFAISSNVQLVMCVHVPGAEVRRRPKIAARVWRRFWEINLGFVHFLEANRTSPSTRRRLLRAGLSSSH